MAARRLEAAVPTNMLQAFAAIFITCSELRDWLTSECQSVALAKSILSRTKLGFEIWSRKWKEKFAHQQWWKIHGIQKRLAELHRSWAVLFRRSFKTRDLSGAVVYISLHSTMYTTPIDRQNTCRARFIWKDTRPPLFFPTTKWRKKSLNSVTVHL